MRERDNEAHRAPETLRERDNEAHSTPKNEEKREQRCAEWCLLSSTRFTVGHCFCHRQSPASLGLYPGILTVLNILNIPDIPEILTEKWNIPDPRINPVRPERWGFLF